jgi:cytochrome c553
MDKITLKNRLKYTIEANRISRLSQSSQDEMLKDLKERHKKAVGNNLVNMKDDDPSDQDIPF